jgi:4-diphosphocytidyl-2-C-methyl-D-erythritol kinase
MPLVLNSPCKVNLLLNILGIRSDGFHDLETVLLPVPLHDSITLERSEPGIQLTCSEPSLPVDQRNLVHRAATSFLAALSGSEGVRIHLEKRIPMEAGLGGGSANAATTLLGLNQVFQSPLSFADLTALAAKLGSDVPFFLQSGPALGLGRGEIIQPLPAFAALRGFHIILAHPGFGISTPWAYQQLVHFPKARHGTPGRAARLAELLQKDARQAATEFYNSLEAPALLKHPLLALFQEFFRQEGAVGTLMSGSGSSTFALAPDQQTAARILHKFHQRFGDKIWTRAIALDSEG